MRRPTFIFYYISLHSSQNKKRFGKKFQRKGNKYFMFNNVSREKCSFLDNVKKNCRRGHKWQCGACAFHAGCLRLQTYSQNMEYLVVIPQCIVETEKRRNGTAFEVLKKVRPSIMGTEPISNRILRLSINIKGHFYSSTVINVCINRNV